MRHRIIYQGLLIILTCSVSFALPGKQTGTLPDKTLAKTLGWTLAVDRFCGGYYLDLPFTEGALRSDNHIEITGSEGLFSFHGTSKGSGKITITRTAQEISADHVHLFRDPVSEKLRTFTLNGHIILREPRTLVIAEEGSFDLRTKEELLRDVIYRTTLTHSQTVRDPRTLKKAQPILEPSAFGQASVFKKTGTGLIELMNATYSTCPPVAKAWHLYASRVTLNKTSGRGTATHARLYLGKVPVFYTPWLNFPIDARRQTGFLPPAFGSSGKVGNWIRVPFYWNMAPNYDLTLTPALLAKRSLQLTGLFRYLTAKSNGRILVTALPNDYTFNAFQLASKEQFSNSSDNMIQAELRRLLHAPSIRSAVTILDDTRFDAHWSSHIDYNRVSDDYYLRDLNSNLNEVTNNQLLQEGSLAYESQFWQFTGRLQGYQALHPLDEVSSVQNQYARLPQLSLSGYRPDGPFGLQGFASAELTRFALSPTPGSQTLLPTGNRIHIQPGLSLPIERTWFYVTPRLQFALTEYRLVSQTAPASNNPTRSLPLFDTHAGLFFDRDFHSAGTQWRQTLEPEIYYNYVPFRNQNNLPLFDTSNNTLTYDQLFIYNRFNGLDRIGDTSQISYGITSRLINGESGLEKAHVGIGQILYFKDRLVTIGTPSPDNQYDKSPLTGVLSWQITPEWGMSVDSIWNVRTNAFDNQTVALAYHLNTQQTVNFGYSFIRGGDLQQGDIPNSNASNLSQTDLSFAWPISNHWNVVGRWTQNWNHHHFQNLLYGLEYDTCCWAVRLVAARAFVGLNPAGTTFQYDTGISFEFALKGLGSISNSDPSQLLSNSIAGYQSNFGQIT